ncbi:MAG: CheR family methyltransferase, partial [Methylococcales bacterium]|nr:CheR family methyltransferase [Methylococcales bacterium]
LASDLNTHILDVARASIYPMARLDHIPEAYLRKYCLKGVRSQSGVFRVDAPIRSKVQFRQLNLKDPVPANLGSFDIIFLRNVLIYFPPEIKKSVVERLVRVLRPGGYFFVSHSESLYRVTDSLIQVRPSIYRKT